MAERRGGLFGRKGDPLPQFQLRRVMAAANQQELHAAPPGTEALIVVAIGLAL